jgi:hypothetical protein
MATQFPKLQCFPIGQPDGGRDGWDPETKTVLQVKFRRVDEEDGSDWLIDTLKKELPKILRLAKQGVENYIIATNARGTAHKDVGRIDKVQKWLDNNLPIPGTCFWRDEIDRRFDSATVSLRLKYSELLSLEDGIDVALGAILGSNYERQQDAIRAFIAAQFKSDKTVKFKQVSLSNDLLDLFIDVPIGFPQKPFERPGRGASRDHLSSFISSLMGSDSHLYDEGESAGREFFSPDRSDLFHRLQLGTAEILLGSAAQEHLKLVVLEGAPGQGKSTLAQYVCQMHRARYLRKLDVLDRVAEVYKQTAFRVPIKVDLRDYAAFLEGNSPFASESSPSGPHTLDVFLAQLIGYNSGGIKFTAHDVLSLLKNAPTLLFLDGLDEVADTSAREVLVSSIGAALARWGEFDADIQVVVTSRPSVFGRAPSFGKLGFVTLTLQNIDRKRIDEYADKWVAARGLDDAEKQDVKKILDEKLELAHIRDLTRNPMQLTILLSLIHQVGHSLPNQRTDLYTRYVDLFLTREADKSVRVRQNREVLLGFIQHLAWVLQTQAESSKTAGSISAEGLQDMAREYLRAGGRAVEIADDLFGGGLERVFVLVERIEGLYEFEVQPLREFYCAQYLYTTAPVGTYRDQKLRGDRAQRFEALAANPFWLNVCRFYAGSCERGETGTLVMSLKEMIGAGDLAQASHARRVGLSLLQDWVFSNVKYAQDELIQAIFDDNGTEILMSSGGRLVEELILDVECGRNTLRRCIFNLLKTRPIGTRTSAFCHAIRVNGGSELSQEFCELLVNLTGEDRTSQLIRMFRSGASSTLTPEQLWQLITEDKPASDQVLLRSSELLRSDPTKAVKIPFLVQVFTQGVLDGLVRNGGHPASLLGMFPGVLGGWPSAYMRLRRLEHIMVADENLDLFGKRAVPAAVLDFFDEVNQLSLDTVDYAFNQRAAPSLLNSIAEIARKQFGDTWATMSMAIRAAGIKTAIELPNGSDRLFDTTVPVCARARAARLRRAGTKWWLDQLELASSSLDRRLWVGLVLMWSSPKNLYELASNTNVIVDKLSDDEYDALRATITQASSSRYLRADRKKLTKVDLKAFSDRASILVAVAFGTDSSKLLYSRSQQQREPLRTFLKRRREIESLNELPSWKDQERALAWARQVADMIQDGCRPNLRARRHLFKCRLLAETAEKILKEPRVYPLEIVSSAVMTAQSHYRPRTLAAVSSEQDWIFD